MNKLSILLSVAIILPSLLANRLLDRKDNRQIGEKNGPSTFNWNDDIYRLPGDLLPSSYVIRLLPFIEEGNFTTDGYVEITFNVVQDTNNITLNSLDITIDPLDISVTDVQTGSPMALIGFYDEQTTTQKITVKTAVTLRTDEQYKISIKFISILNDQLNGFYRSSYVENGVTKYLATSQMEAADARLAFPCFDEPNMKANFSIILGRKESMTSSSNMPLKETKPIDNMPGYVWDFFETSPTMSTYLVALMVSEFVSTPSDSSLSNVNFRVITRADLQPYTTYAANIGPRILEYFEGFLGVDYPLSKEDMAAVPDFGPGAMENWGHMNFREDFLLVDENRTTAADKQLVSEVISHELAHQWFGDLVTMDWWNVIWLNEGFARYLQYIGVDAVQPTFRMLEQFPVNTLQRVFAADVLPTSHPMSKPQTQSHVFDTIEYDKGASVLRMCAGFLGMDTFQRGLNTYLTQNSYSNALEEDLWNTLEYQAAVDGVILPESLVKIMGSWTQNANYPLITITRDYTGSFDGALVEQERLVLPNSDGTTDPKVTVWWVPLTFTHNFSLPSTTAWLSSKNKKLVSLAAKQDEWVIFNVNQTGFYRVAYDETNYGLIADQLVADHEKVSVINRAQLLDDAFNLAKFDVISYNQALDLTLYLKYELEYVPWHAVINEFDYIDVMLHNEVQYSDWTKYMTTLVTPYYNSVGFEESKTDAHLTILSRGEALNLACRFKLADCVQNVQQKYAALMVEPAMILSPNQRSFILSFGVENGKQAEFDFAFAQYSQSGANDFLIAMTYTRISTIIYDLLNKMLDPNSIKPEDVDTLFTNLAANPLGNAMAFDFLAKRWDDIEAALGPSHFVGFFRSLCNRLNKEEQYNQMKNLRDSHEEILGASETVQQGLDVIRSNIKWMENNQQEVGDWLVDPSTVTASQTTTEPTTEPITETTTETTTSTQTTTTVVSSSTQTPTTTTLGTTSNPVSGSGTIQSQLTFTLACVLVGRLILNR